MTARSFVKFLKIGIWKDFGVKTCFLNSELTWNMPFIMDFSLEELIERIGYSKSWASSSSVGSICKNLISFGESLGLERHISEQIILSSLDSFFFSFFKAHFEASSMLMMISDVSRIISEW
ncbi:unnamed protein product [Blepharisma stoltei]|uniref:Maturase K n=1 Tax=Blepharisma stoltei TaxID=1481888 RepID=A0AAU9J1S5_9CILI|nr:unnamed protein product [Blepharisma stoltei]